MSTKGHAVNYHIINPKLGNPDRTINVHASPEQIKHLVVQGYLIQEGLFSSEQIESMREALEQVAAAEKDYVDPNYLQGPGQGRYLRWLIDKHPAFISLFECEATRSIAQAVLGPQVHFENVDARIANPEVGGQAVPWHIHLRVVPKPLPPFFCYPHALHCILYLDDIDESKGELCVLPGSHRKFHYEVEKNDISDKPGQIALSVKAGTCVIAHANLWHRTLPCKSQPGPRRLLLFSYAPSWLRSDQTGGVKPERSFAGEQLNSTADPMIRELAGEFYWS